MRYRRQGVLRRMASLIQGLFAGWLSDREGERPRAVYERAITERTNQYAELKQTVAGVLYMRNKIEGEIRERRGEVARVQSDIARAVRRDDDPLALELISRKDQLMAELDRAESELGEVSAECDAAKSNLVKFRSEIQSLEREKTRMLATLANARARRRFHEALQGLSVDADVRALEGVREQIARLKTEAHVDTELENPDLRSRMRALREEARSEAAQHELAELKRVFRGGSLLKPAVVVPGASAS